MLAHATSNRNPTVPNKSNYPPAEPEALRLLAPRRGRIATDKVKTNNCTPRI